MKKTGYVVVDCTGINLLAQSKTTVTGIYAKCQAAFDSGKPVFACNCVYGTGVPMSPIQVFGIKESGNYIFTASILQLTIEDDDGVTIASLIGG